MKLLDKIQRDVDEIAEFGFCNYVETFKTLIEAKERIEELELAQEQALIDRIATDDTIPLQPLLDSIDHYVEGQENHIATRSSDKMLTIKSVAHWCKFYAKKLAK